MLISAHASSSVILNLFYSTHPFLSSYARMWALAHGALEDLLVDEFPPPAPRPQKDRLQIFQGLATFYLKYLQIFRSLEAIYDQIVHPQKRRVVRHVLDAVMGRLLELKNEMVELEFSEFHYFDDVLQDLKMTPVSVAQGCGRFQPYCGIHCERIVLVIFKLDPTFQSSAIIPIDSYKSSHFSVKKDIFVFFRTFVVCYVVAPTK